MVRHVVSPFDLSQTLPIGGGLLVPRSLPGPPVIKQLMQMVTMVPGQGGRFQSVASPNKSTSYGALSTQLHALHAQKTLLPGDRRMRLSLRPLSAHSRLGSCGWSFQAGPQRRRRPGGSCLSSRAEAQGTGKKHRWQLRMLRARSLNLPKIKLGKQLQGATTQAHPER